jgi:diguanylate cyclase
VLRAAARAVRTNMRSFDLAARYGGEEFAVLLPGATETEALAVARRINRVLAARPFVIRHSRRRLGHVTLSIGVAQLRPNESAVSVLLRADRALYLAKRNGRNQVCSDEAGPP